MASTAEGNRHLIPGSPAGILWAYSLGVGATGCLPELPQWPLWLLASGSLLLLAWLLRPLRSLLPLALALVLGASWALWHNHRALADRLPMAQHSADFLLPVEVVSLPRRGGGGARDSAPASPADLRFTARVLAREAAWPVPDSFAGQRLLLTWYRAPPDVVGKLTGGSAWLLPVRLKRPRGTVNPHAFDYEGWLLREGIYATGYVRPADGEPRLLGQRRGVAAWRQGLRERLERQGPPRLELVSALLLGDRGGLAREDQRLLRSTGTAHLVAISGLHVGMVAGFFLLASGILVRGLGAAGLRCFAGLPAACALAAAGLYTLLAGAPLSAQRALVMTAIFLLALIWRRRLSGWLAYALALAVVLTLQPLAIFSPGFWLSFIAVAALMLAFAGRRKVGQGKQPGPVRRGLRWLADMTRGQWAVTLGLLVPSLYLFSGASAIALGVNLVAIPWVGFGILPLLMLGTLFGDSVIGITLVGLAGEQLDQLMALLGYLDGAGAWQPMGFVAGVAGLALSAIALLILSLPRGVPGRHIGWTFVLLVAVPATFPARQWGGGLQVTIFDVGQGLAVLVAADGDYLLYDAGPSSRSGWNAGEAILVPYLLEEGVGALDTLVVSHGDRDHRGGLGGVLAGVPVATLLAPGTLADRLEPPPATDASACLAGQEIGRGGLTARVLWPMAPSVSGEENDHSCVLLLEWRSRRILLAGDISAAVEKQLLASNPGFEPVDLVVAPHHGSRTSSSPGFVYWARPRSVVFSAGFRHHFGHPHPDVVARYREAGAKLFNTADTGALEFSWDGVNAEPSVKTARSFPRFWLLQSVKK
ncbi:DNA internalization-related competence protein ComEC/Rec2 [Microbulbifer yueqingensis]|uniref:Competence protein ComEC n=1 Tax=Microbulbifer yueqingensis TaxID=658219 RepID=A0A1G9A155_9GAMM|nr:DNA internalization-related competence protein ComEC/Rec2 [Microbulbifer yueqingensis]SDK21098.1 competence protein ComEC [Microbulbifer yueqingensis]